MSTDFPDWYQDELNSNADDTQSSQTIAKPHVVGGSDKGTIEFKIQKKRPKKNAKSYNIETVQDIFDAVNSKNIKKFLREFEMVLRSGLLLKAIHEANIAEGKYSAEEAGKLELPRFTWIDD